MTAIEERIKFDIDRWRTYDCTDDEIVVGLKDAQYAFQLAQEFKVDTVIVRGILAATVTDIQVGSFVPPTDDEVQEAIDKLLNMAQDLA